MEAVEYIQSVMEKMKAEQHLIFGSSGSDHVTREDYDNRKYNPKNLIEKIKRDLKLMMDVTERANDKYVLLDEGMGLASTDVKPEGMTYLFRVAFKGYNYLMLKSKELMLLINYAPEGMKICQEYNGALDFLPREGICDRTIQRVQHPSVKYAINTYTSFCGFCKIHLGIPSNKLAAKYNKDFAEHIQAILNCTKFPDSASDEVRAYDIGGKTIYTRLIKVYNVVIVYDWLIKPV